MNVLIVTRDGGGVEYSRNKFFIKFSDYGVTITAKSGYECGWVNRVIPWSNIGLIQESKEGK